MRKSKLSLFNTGLFLFAYALMASTLSCTKEKRDYTNLSSGGVSGASTLSSLYSEVIGPSCATSGCHDSRANPAGSLDLSSLDKTYRNLVGVASIQLRSELLVKAGDPTHSYLIDKLLGNQSLAGGSGDRMPQYEAALTSDQMTRITTWILNGAEKN